MTARVAIVLAAASLAACGGGSDRDAKYPKRPEGCEVTLYRDIPPVPTENIGPVHARCGDDIAPDDCIRTLKDAVCRLGGDVVWAVDGPDRKEDGKLHYNGRAAHTKAPKR